MVSPRGILMDNLISFIFVSFIIQESKLVN